MNSKEHVLVTGGAGLIGSNLVRRLVREGFRVSVVDNLWRGKVERLTDDAGRSLIGNGVRLHLLDLSVQGVCDPLLGDVDYVYHLADVVAGIDYIFRNQGWIFRRNILINSNMIASVRRHPVKGFIYAGTACSFPAHLQNDVNARPLREEDAYPAAPESAYGWCKLMGEYETMLMAQETDIPVCVLIFHNVYGPPSDYSKERGQVIPSLVRKAILHPREPFVVWGDGTQGRAFVYVDDAIDALMSAMTNGWGKGPIQVGPDTCTTIREIAERVVEVSGKGIEIEFDLSKPRGDQGRRADYARARKILGWRPRVGLRQGITDLYKWIEADMKSK
ncbi:MAG: NAD-dependent epimerase/dehydratase family protein [Desulfobacterales bacterium]|nr:NAD-dependent epimerase/dehydratase family protein [Desulfobacterales bacterium]